MMGRGSCAARASFLMVLSDLTRSFCMWLVDEADRAAEAMVLS